MMNVKPNFYDEFRCKAGECRNTCCAGWEIDIDKASLEKYLLVDNDFSQKFRSGIDFNMSPECFRLKEQERCYFLDNNGLCEIYSHLGEDMLCDICREHPRFYDCFESFCDSGLGLCCEKTCELIFSSDEPITFIVENDACDSMTEDDKLCYTARENIFDIICDRKSSLENRVRRALDYCVALQNELFDDEYNFNENEINEYFKAAVMLHAQTEPIDEEWTLLSEDINKNYDRYFSCFPVVIKDEIRYEQILTYLLFRHYLALKDEGDFISTVCFCLAGLMFIIMADCRTEFHGDSKNNEEKIENVRKWSEQIEYSSENTRFLYENAKDVFFC